MSSWMKGTCLVLAIGVVVAGCTRFTSGSAPSGQEETAPAEMGSLTATVGATGTVRPDQEAVLSFKTSGTVEQVLVEVGDKIRSGDKLAVLRDTSLPATVLLARADLVAAQRALDDVLHSKQAAAQAQLAVADARDFETAADYNNHQEGNRGRPRR
jgi:multidrug efflux pump subunit AcrA (membrane-fusion protein)